jgi:hypothetical protein
VSECDLSFVDYPVPLRGGSVVARLRLPIDLKSTDLPVIKAILYAIAEAGDCAGASRREEAGAKP